MSENGQQSTKEKRNVAGSSMIDPTTAYEAMKSHDTRFDGVFYVGVTSTGIYCRPICRVKTPQQKNCRFFSSAEAAEKSRFRPCLRCRPELAPGHAPVDNAQRIAQLLVHRIDEGLIEDGSRLEEISAQFGVSSRQLRRIVQAELGVSPIELMQTRRLLLAKQLLTETKLPVTEIAFASGFSSLRRFNDAFSSQYRMPPTRLRREAAETGSSFNAGDTSVLRLSYRPPYDWGAIMEFLHGRMVKDVEVVTPEAYTRTVRLGQHTGWIRVTHAPEKNSLLVEFTHSLSPALPALLGRLRNLFDLSAQPDLISAHLKKDPLLRPSVAKNPGLRVPGAFDGFEMAVRAILGQQITVKAATTISCRFAEAFGEKFKTPFPELSRLSPLAARVARASVDDVARLGIVSKRSQCIIALAKGFASGELQLEPGSDPEGAIKKLVEVPGIGPWTAHYIAMRALHWPDAFPKEDIAVLNNLGRISPKAAEVMSKRWSPWRGYAVLHIWKNLSNSSPKSPDSTQRLSK